MTREYYQSNRVSILAKAHARHQRDKSSPAYRSLTNLRKKLVRLRDMVGEYRRKTKCAQTRISKIERRIEELELRWGRERAQRKAGRCQNQ